MSTAELSAGTGSGGKPPTIAWLAWVWVGVPFLYGFIALVMRIPALFGG